MSNSEKRITSVVGMYACIIMSNITNGWVKYLWFSLMIYWLVFYAINLVKSDKDE